MDDRPCARGGNCRATATTATATTATATTTTRAWSAPGRVPVCTWTGLRGMPWRNGDPPAASIGDRYRHGAGGGGGGALGRLVLSVRTPLRALSKRRKRRCNAPALRFPTSVLRLHLRRFAPPRPGGLGGWGGHAGLPKITKFISSDTGKRKKWQVVF
eukprot:gene14895-biopygen12676